MIKTILQDFIYGLDNIARYNGMLTLQPKETVSQHSYWVTFYSNLIFRGLFHREIMTTESSDSLMEKINTYNKMYVFLFKQALYHDFDENFTGDILYDTKYDDVFGDEIKKWLNKIKLKELENIPRDELYHDYCSVLKTDNFVEVPGYELTIAQKQVCLNLLKMADWMSCLRYGLTEVKLGNKSFEQIVSRAIGGIESCLTQVEVTLSMGGDYDNHFCLTTRSELIELKSKFNIL